MRSLFSILLAVCLLAVPLSTFADNTAGLKKKIMLDQKKLVIMKNVELSEEEAKAFWPIYDEFQEELFQISQDGARLIIAYADAYQTLSDEQAGKLIEEYFKVREARTTAMKDYTQKFAEVLPGKKLFRYLQVENKLEAIGRVQVAGEIPLAQ